MTLESETRLRALTNEQFAFVAGAVLEALDDGAGSAATEAELDAATRLDAAVIRDAAAALDADTGLEAADRPDQAALLSAAAAISPPAATALNSALARLSEPDVRLPVFGLGGAEIILLAIAAAIVRPRMDVERDATSDRGTRTRLRLAIEGTPQLDKVIRAAASLLSRLGM